MLPRIREPPVMLWTITSYWATLRFSVRHGGIRDNPDPVEEEGIRRTQDRIRGADVVIVVLDGSALPDDEDWNVLAACREKRTLVVLNKMDLGLC